MNNFGNLTVNVSKGATNVAMTAGMAYTQGAIRSVFSDNTLIQYNVNRPYKNVLVYEAKRALLAEAVKAVYSIVPNIIKKAQQKRIKERDTKITSTNTTIIDNGNVIVENYGKITTTDGKKLVAYNAWGEMEQTALILSFKGDKAIKYEQISGRNSVDVTIGKTNMLESVLGMSGRKTDKKSAKVDIVESVDVVVFDLQPKIDCSSDRNISITPVQGRDYSRKEIIGNGDVKFSVSGKFVCNNPGVYPQDQVSRFIQIARHNGIISVNNLLFGQHNVKNIIIQGYSLPQTECLNEQPYSFSCVAVEPDEEVTSRDTISTVLYEAGASKLDGWYNNVLLQKLAKQAENLAVTVGASSMGSLNELTSNI